MGIAIGWFILAVIALIACLLALAAIHFVMEGYQYDDEDEYTWYDANEGL